MPYLPADYCDRKGILHPAEHIVRETSKAQSEELLQQLFLLLEREAAHGNHSVCEKIR